MVALVSNVLWPNDDVKLDSSGKFAAVASASGCRRNSGTGASVCEVQHQVTNWAIVHANDAATESHA